MITQFIQFVDEDVDGCGTDVTVYAQIEGNEITQETILRVKDAIANYKNDNEGEWDTDGCLDAAQEQLAAEGYAVMWVVPRCEIRF